MLRQRLWISYEGTAREDPLAPLPWPVWFRCCNRGLAAPVPPLGLDVMDGVGGRFSLFRETDEDKPMGNLYSCKLHLWVCLCFPFLVMPN